MISLFQGLRTHRPRPMKARDVQSGLPTRIARAFMSGVVSADSARSSKSARNELCDEDSGDTIDSDRGNTSCCRELGKTREINVDKYPESTTL